MNEQEALIFETTVKNQLFGLPEVLDKNIDDIIVNENDTIPIQPSDRYNITFLLKIYKYN